MRGLVRFIWTHIIFLSQKNDYSNILFLKSSFVSKLIFGGDEIMCRSPNFVILRKNEVRGLSITEGQNGFDQSLGTLCTDFNTGKNIGNLKKVWRKKMFLLKSVTKLEDLTVPLILKCYMVTEHYTFGPEAMHAPHI
jgi:hypothetical protein